MIICASVFLVVAVVVALLTKLHLPPVRVQVGASPETFIERERKMLELLADGPAYGLDLVKRSGGVLCRGTVYVTLSRMTDDGWVEYSMVQTRMPMPERNLYRLTPAGARVSEQLALIKARKDR